MQKPLTLSQYTTKKKFATTPHLSVTPTGSIIGTPTAAQSFVTGLPITAETSATGVALINGTGAIITAIVPNDGKVHQVVATMIKSVTSALTGGRTSVHWTNPLGVVTSLTTTQTAVGTYGTSSTASPLSLASPGTTVYASQTSAMTTGAAKVYAKIVII